MQRPLPVFLMVLAMLLTSRPLLAQGDTSSSFESIPWERSPVLGKLGNEANVTVVGECVFTGAAGTAEFMTQLENPVNGDELGTVLCRLGDGPTASEWFAIFEYDNIGYVKDDDKGSLDADAIMKSLREGTEAGNRERAKRGWQTLEIVGWAREPYYDSSTNNLTWATRIKGANSSNETINHSVRLLGRNGVMSVDLVTSANDYALALAPFDSLVATHKFVPGKTYAEWTKGDKVAAIGLTALVAGGAGAALASSGLLAKFGKAIIAGLVALVAAIRGLFRRKDQA